MQIIGKIVGLIALAIVVSCGLTLSWPLLALSVFCVALIGLLLVVGGHSDVRLKRVDWLVLCVIGYFSYRMFFSPVWDLAKEDLMLMAGGVIVYYLSRLRWPSRGWAIVFSSCVVVNLMVYILQMTGVVVWLPLGLVDEFTSQTASFGLFQDYGALGNAMAVISVVLFSFAHCARHVGKRLRWIVGLISVLALVLVFFSGSRSAVISVAMAGGVMVPVLWLRTAGLDVHLRRRARLLLAGGACCAAVLAASLSLMTFAERDGKVLQTGVATESNIRQGYWGMAVDQWQQAPVLGQGARTYSYKSNEFWEGILASHEASPEFVHNEYLQVLADYGLVGLVMLLILLGTHWFIALRSLLLEDKVSRRSWMRLAGLLGVTVVMVHSFTDFPLRLPFNMFLATVCLGWCAGGEERGKRKEGNKERGERLKEKGQDDGGEVRGERLKEKGARKSSEFRVQCSDLGDGTKKNKERGERLEGKGVRKSSEFRVQCSDVDDETKKNKERGERLKEKGQGDGTKKNKERGERIKDRGLAVVLMLFSAGVAVFAGREVWAAAPLLVEKQAREGGAWSPVGHEGLLESYTLANERSADFRRSQRIAQIYHLNYAQGDETALVMAEMFYKESLGRHPYNPVPLLNLANLYRDAGRYAAAEIYYDRAEPYVAARDWSFKYYTHLSELKIAQGERAYAKGEFDAADLFLAEASETAMSGQSASQPRQQIQRDCYVARVRMAVEQGEYEKTDALWAEARKQVKPWILREKEAMVYLVLGNAYFEAASAEWKERKPELAKQLFLKAQKFYKRDVSIRNGVADEKRDERFEFAEKALEVLKAGGF
ncbi:hypothetical protein BSZ32_05870 [Rubritalea profundi]|uniref:O-antigen ligase-related domain-containing protein n=2 Tax=Rubritalea profundi TaxID=1658618 RepID=A0A2S7TZA4_9BACT|nr:hypothetical protein BSZ32_05870 [Rubritalea profundi]